MFAADAFHGAANVPRRRSSAFQNSSGDALRALTPALRGDDGPGRGGRTSGHTGSSSSSAFGSRPASVPLASSKSASRRDMRPPLERLLDRRLQSVSTFISSTSGLNDSIDKAAELPSQWSDDMPCIITFPTNRPCSRADAVVLNQWVTSSLGRYADKLSASGEEGNLSQVVDELVPILSIALHEVVRQVTQYCLERGVVLEKIWRTYVELFERALAETRALLRYHKVRTQKVQEEHERTKEELRQVQRRHPEQIDKLSNTLLNKFSQRQEELEQNLRSLRHENTVLKQHLQEHTQSVKAWFPLFQTYKDSAFKASLQGTSVSLPTSMTPEARLAADFQRIITTMPDEGRRRVGFFVGSLLGLRGAGDMDDPDTVESLTEQRDHNSWQIDRLQQRIKELRGERNKTGAQ